MMMLSATNALTMWDMMIGTACYAYDKPFKCGVAGYAGANPASNSLWGQSKICAWLTMRPIRDIDKGA